MWWNYHSAGSGWPWTWWMLTHGILSLFLFMLVMVGIVTLLRSAFGVGAHGVRGRGRSPGHDVLEERYAKGEIQREEYLQKKRDLGG